MKHILVLPSYFTDPDRPINGVYFYELASAYKKFYQDEIVSICFVEPRSLRNINIRNILFSRFNIKKYNCHEVIIYKMHGWNLGYNSLIGRKLYHYLLLILFKFYINKEGIPDLIHVQSSLLTGYTAKYISNKYKIPYIITEHSSYFLNLNNNNYKSYLNSVYKDSKFVTAVSRYLAFKINKYYVKDIIITPNLFFLVNNKNKNYIKYNRDVFVITCISSLIFDKGLHILISSFAKFHIKNSNFVLQIVGTGSYYQHLNNLVNRLGMKNNIIFLGHQNRDNIINILENSNYYVLPSFYETFNISLIEALGVGLPCLATRSGGPEEIINKIGGILVEPNNINELLIGLYKLISVNNHDSKKQIELVNNLYGQKAITLMWYKLYEDAVN